MNQIIYPFIPKDRTILYVGPGNEFMKAAEAACKELSTVTYHPTGAVLVKDGKVIARVGSYATIKNQKLLELHRKGFCVRKLFKIPSGQKYWLCPGCASYKNHSETLIVKEARRRGVSTEGSDLYLWGHWWCCEPCWNSIISGGIRDVYLLEGSEKLFNPKFPENIIGK